MVAEDVEAGHVELREYGRDDVEAGPVAVDEVAEVYGELEGEFVELFDAGLEFRWGVAVLAYAAGRVVAVLAVGDDAEGEGGGLGEGSDWREKKKGSPMD